jgi:CheY-like chemotaxis protein
MTRGIASFASIDLATSLRIISSPLDSFIHQLVYVVAPFALCALVVGATVGVLVRTFGKEFMRFLRGLLPVWSSLPTMQILIVEDNSNSRETLKLYLTCRHYNVSAAGTLRTGIGFLNKNRFDAIISDISLPDGTGYTLINEARRRGIRALSIAMSGYPFPSNVNEPGVTGFDYHLTKPINCDHLYSLLKQSRASAGDASTTSKISQAVLLAERDCGQGHARPPV